MPIPRPALHLATLILALALAVLRPGDAHAGARRVTVWIWAEAGGVGLRFDEPLLHTWRLQDAATPEALAPVLDDPDLARLERTARIALRIEGEALRGVAEALQRALVSAGFSEPVIKPWSLASSFERQREQPVFGRSRAGITLRARPAPAAGAAEDATTAASLEVLLEARLRLVGVETGFFFNVLDP